MSLLATKRHVSTLLFALLLSVLLAACGGEDSSSEESAALQTVESGEVRLEFPRSVPVGSPFEVTWTGPDRSNDYVSIAEEGTSGGETVDYTRTRQGSPLTVRAPDTPGSYEVRYVSAESDEIQAQGTITVNDVQAQLDVPSEVGAGAPVEVAWSGPDNPDDYISIAEQGTSGGETVDYTRTRQGNPLTVRAPDTPGSYEIRYVMSQSDRILTSTPLTVTSVSASFDVPDTLMVDTPVEIQWSGPDNPDDYISIAEQGSPSDASVVYERTRRGQPLSIRTPPRPGRYELRYVMAQSDRVIAQKTLTILPLQARLRAPDTVEAGRGMDVSWVGPNGPDDFIAVARPESSADQYESRALSRAGTPANVFAPSEPGTYELRYVWAEEDSVLTRTPLVVESP